MPYKDPKPKLDIGRLDHLVTAAVSDVSALSLLPIGMFSNATLLNLSEDDWFLRDDIPTFHNLIHLQIGVYKNWPTFVSCLRNFPKLETLVVCELHMDDGDDDDVVLMEATEVPSCVSSHLKVFVLCTLFCSDGVKMARGIYNSMLILGIKIVLRFVGQKEKANASESLNMVVPFWVAFILSLSYMSLSHSHKNGNS